MYGWHFLYEYTVRHGGKRPAQQLTQKTKRNTSSARYRQVVQCECGALALTGLCDDWGNCRGCECRDRLQEAEETEDYE